MRKCPSGADVGLKPSFYSGILRIAPACVLLPSCLPSQLHSQTGLPPVLESPLPQAPGAIAPEALPWLPCQLSHDLSAALSRSSAHPLPSLQLRGSRVLTLARPPPSPTWGDAGQGWGRRSGGGWGTCFQKKNEWKLEEGNTKCCLYGTVK